MLQKSLGYTIAGFGAHTSKGRRKVDGVWIAGMFNPDGQTFKDRYGFTLEETNGSPVGERGPSEDLQSVIRHLDNPFMIENNLVYQVRTFWDVTDCRYVMIGQQTAYDKIIRPVLDRYRDAPPVVVAPPVDPPTPPVPVDPPKPPVVGDPCAEYQSQIKMLQEQISDTQNDLRETMDLLSAENKIVDKIQTLTAKAARWRSVERLQDLIRQIQKLVA